MKIYLSNNDGPDDTVTIICHDQDAALDDQSIMGSRWEAPRDMDIAYAIVLNQPKLDEILEQDGYDVDSSEWCPPDIEENNK